MLQRLILVVLCSIWFLNAHAQMKCPVAWKYHAEKTAPGEWNIIFDACIGEHWHLYTQKTFPDTVIAPLPTVISVDSADEKTMQAIKFDGKATEEGDKIIKAEPLFEGTVIEWYEGHASFIQKVKVSSTSDTIKGYVDYMVCNDAECMRGEPVEWKIVFDEKSDSTPDVLFDTQDCPYASSGNVGKCADQKKNPAPVVGTKSSKIDYPTCSNGYKFGELSGNIWIMFLAGIGGGLLALIMPCTFPMIPMTVSFFLKRNKERSKAIREALIYGLSIILIYTIPAYIVAKVFGSDALNAFSSSAFFNILFFVVFIIFAFSMLGYFEINMPSWMVNKSDSMGDKGGILGIFFMAFTLALVSFSCTGPVLGGLLATLTTQGNDTGLILGFLGFSIAMAVPFALFAMFPNMLKSLPKSGGWMTTIKVVLGLIELAFAFKFFSNVDLAYHLGILKLEPFLLIWIVIAVVIGLYLFDIINPFPHDIKGERVGWIFKGLGVLFILFAGYLTMGLFGKNLSLISGFPPPSYYAWFAKKTDCPEGLECYPNGLVAYKNKLTEGIEASKKEGKPILLDFTGFSCVNCRKMEDNVWPKPEVYDILKKNFILVSLYVDDKAALSESEVFVDSRTNKKISTIGAKWSKLERDFIYQNAQPYYVVVDENLNYLSPPTGFTSATTYASFLKCGLENYKNKNSTTSNYSEIQLKP